MTFPVDPKAASRGELCSRGIGCCLPTFTEGYAPLTPGCKLSPLFPALCERGRICRASRGRSPPRVSGKVESYENRELSKGGEKKNLPTYLEFDLCFIWGRGGCA